MEQFLDKALSLKANTLSITLCNHNTDLNRNILLKKLDKDFFSNLYCELLTSKYNTVKRSIFKNSIYRYGFMHYNYTKNECYKDLFIEHNLFELNDTLDLYCQYSNINPIDPLYFPCKQNYHINTIEEGTVFSITDTISIYTYNNNTLKIIVKIDAYIDNTLETLKRFISTVKLLNTI